MFNRDLYNAKRIDEWSSQFNNAQPFRFLVIDNFLDFDLAQSLSKEFPSLEYMDVNYKGINEKKSEHSSFENLHPVFTNFKDAITRKEVTCIIENIAQIDKLETIEDRYGFGLHQGGQHSFLDIHVDYNLHPIRKKQRRLNLIIFLNPEWNQEWGGALEFWDKHVTSCRQSISPVFNRCVLFECNEYSYHGYSKINCPETITRKSFYLYYFSNPEQPMIFHDTIFKNKPSEPLSKRFVVSLKEATKNFIKRILYYSGLSRFLK